MPSATERSILTAPGPVARAASVAAQRVVRYEAALAERLGGQADKEDPTP